MPDIFATDWGTREPELVRQLTQGSEAAFGAIYQRYQGPIFRFCWHMSSDPAMAEDVTQEVFMHLIRNPRMFDPSKGSLGGYLFGIARNSVRRNLSRTRKQESFPDEDSDSELAQAVGECDLLSDLSRSELLDFLKDSLRALPEPYREAVVLCDMEEMSYPDAAVALGCSPGTIASRLHRGRSMLKSRLTRRFGNTGRPGKHTKQECAR